MNRGLIRSGFVLFLLSLITGFIVPVLPIPRLGLSAHTIGVISCLLLISVGVVWDSIIIGPGPKKALHWLWILVGFGNWFATLLAACIGGSTFMPIAGSGATPTGVMAGIVDGVIAGVGIGSILAVLLVIWGLRGNGQASE